MDRCGVVVGSLWVLWIVVGRRGSLWVVVGSLWVLWIVVGRSRSSWIVVGSLWGRCGSCGS